MTEVDHSRALAALCDADRFFYVSRSTYARVDALQTAVRSAHEALRAEIPGAPALPSWGADDEDREIARAAGAGIRPAHVIAAALMAAYVIYFLVLA